MFKWALNILVHDMINLLYYKLGLVNLENYDEIYINTNDLSQRTAW